MIADGGGLVVLSVIDRSFMQTSFTGRSGERGGCVRATEENEDEAPMDLSTVYCRYRCVVALDPKTMYCTVA